MQDFYDPKIGDIAPNFTVPSTAGNEVTLKNLRGKNVILFFYGKDDADEVSAFRDREAELSRTGAVLLGISTDSIDKVAQFRETYRLNFPLLSDATADLAKMYGVWREKNVSGRRTWGVAPAAFWIGSDGRIKRIDRESGAAGRVLAEITRS